jgi:hypothetical protein
MHFASTVTSKDAVKNNIFCRENIDAQVSQNNRKYTFAIATSHIGLILTISTVIETI